ncbi:hypothetical protein JT359_03555 [Candidatus Poribacteria bacterium]|nr:hypothetical protein [Candidatus Poribacteria bacterium]
MALILARTLVEKQTYKETDLKKAYQYWINDNPFDALELATQLVTQ